MSLELILGPANAAKAGIVLGDYRRAPRGDALLVVPTAADAAHYDLELVGEGTALGRALTFPTLIQQIALRVGSERRVLTALQQERVIARTLGADRSESLAASAAGPGMLRAASRLLNDLSTSHISAPRFTAAMRQWASGRGGFEARYALDLAALYMSYARAVQRTGMADEPEHAWEVLDALRGAPHCWGATKVFFYGFDDLTRIQLDTIDTLAHRVGAQVVVSLTYEQDRTVLSGRARVAGDLREIADTVRELKPLDEHYSAGSRRALHHLERSIFQSGSKPEQPGDGVRLVEAGGILAEAEQIAALVARDLRDGVPADEIVIVTRSLSRSAQLLGRTLHGYGVASSSSAQTPVEHTRLGRALLTALRLRYEPDPESVTASQLVAALRAVSSSTQTQELIDRFEAQLLRGRIATARQALEHPAARALGGEGGPLQQIDLIRRDPLPARAIRETVRSLLTQDPNDAHAAAKILTAVDELQALDEPGHTPGGDLLAAISGLTINQAQPPTAAPVLIAEPLQIRARRFRRVYVTGLCEGEFPAGVSNDSDPFLTDDQRFDIAQTAGLALPALEDPIGRERYLLYACLSRATEQVTFSFRTSDEEGQPEQPSAFIDDVRALFDDSLWENRIRRPLGAVTWQPETAPTAREAQLAIAAIGGDRLEDELDDQLPATRSLSAQALTRVRHADTVSAGALVRFAACPVGWLVDNQLHPRDLDPEADPLARGNFMHELLEGTLASLDGPLTTANLEQAIGKLRELGQTTQHKLAPGQAPAVRAAVRDGVVAHLIRFLRTNADSSPRWKPERFETRFGTGDGLPALELSGPQGRVRVSGTIDRVDIDITEPGHAIVRDYKSGSSGEASRAGNKWIEDREIQVALYMLAVRQLLSLEPVGGFYQPLSARDLRGRGSFDESLGPLPGTVGRDGVSADELQRRLSQVQELAVELGTQIKRGELTPCPQTCSKDGCRYPWICWAGQ